MYNVKIKKIFSTPLTNPISYLTVINVFFLICFSMVKNPPAVQETQVQSLGWEDPLEKKMAAHSGILAWRNPWTEEAWELQSMGLQRVEHDLVTNIHTPSH